MASESKKRLALAIVDFLNASSTDGTVSADDKESLEVASQCISDAFKIDPTDKAAMADALGGQSLTAIYSVFEKMKGKTSAKPAAAPSPSPTASSEPTPEQKATAEELKGKGNAAMAKKDFTTAIDFYTQALKIVPNNPIYLSNRAAAYSNTQQYDLAIADAQTAVDADPKYTKAWSRLGLARFANGDARGSMEAYQAGIEAEGNGGSEIMRRGYETAKKKVEEEERGAGTPAEEAPRSAPPGGGMPDLSNLASMLGGGGGAGGGGGMPDLGSLMSNPMFGQIAQNLMSNPGMMQNLMNNPRLKEMMDGVSGGGGLPDMSQLMSDPTIADLAKNLMGGQGDQDGAGPK